MAGNDGVGQGSQNRTVGAGELRVSWFLLIFPCRPSSFGPQAAGRTALISDADTFWATPDSPPTICRTMSEEAPFGVVSRLRSVVFPRRRLTLESSLPPAHEVNVVEDKTGGPFCRDLGCDAQHADDLQRQFNMDAPLQNRMSDPFRPAGTR